MNFSRNSLLALFLPSLGAIGATYEGFSTTTYTPAPSAVVVTSDFPCHLETGIRTFNSWNRPLSQARYIVATPSALSEFTLSGGSSFRAAGKDSTGKTATATCRDVILTPNPLPLKGYNLIRLYPFPYSRKTKRSAGMFPNGILSTEENVDGGIYSIGDDIAARDYLTKIRAGASFTFKSFTTVSYPASVLFPAVGKTTVNGSVYLSEYKNQLRAAGFAFEDLILAKSSSGVVYPVALCKYGTPIKAYAMYGVWHDQDRSSVFGYAPAQKLFMSEREILPDLIVGAPNYTKWPAFSEIGVQADFSFGRQVFTYEEIQSNPAKYYPLLAWRSAQLWSEMDKTFDAAGNLVKYGRGSSAEFPPSAPDNDNNTNPISFAHCPDKDWYFTLYYQCVERELKTDDYSLAHPKKYTDYKDYLQSKAMENYDASIYYEDKSLSTQTASTNNPQGEPALYNSDGQLLNRDIHKYVDPWHSATKFSLQFREGYWEWGTYKHRHKDRDLTTAARGAIQSCLDLYTNKVATNLPELLASTDVKVVWTDPNLKDSALYVGNPVDYFSPYKNGKEFCNYDNNYVNQGGHPFKTQSHLAGGDDEVIGVYNQDNEKNWTVEWNWTLVFKDKNQRKYAAATLFYKKEFYNETDKLMASGQDAGGDKQNRWFKLENEIETDAEFDKYDLNSKEYHTDQHDAHDRNKKIDKGEAMATIVRKIAVAEGLNFLVKAIYAQSDNNYVAALYEGTKRVENTIAVKKTYNMALKAYEAYVLWCQTMDVLADVRDSYNSIGPAWDGMLSSVHNIYEYYKDLDYSKIRLTNITQLLPASTLYNLDWSVYRLQSSLANFNLAIDGMAFQTDRFTKGNYGPFNGYINYAYGELAQSTYESGPASTRVLKTTTTALDGAKNASRNTSSDAAYLSNLTRATHNILVNQDFKIINERTRSMSMALFLVEGESRQWIAYKNHMKNIYTKTPSVVSSASEQNSFVPLMNHFQDPLLFTDVTTTQLREMAE